MDQALVTVAPAADTIWGNGEHKGSRWLGFYPWFWKEADARGPWNWAQSAVVQSALGVIAEAVPDPVFWAVGEWEDMEAAELYPRELLLKEPPPRKLHGTSLIMRFEEAAAIPITEQQGNGHMSGIRIMVFRRHDEPTGLFEEWLDSDWRSGGQVVSELLNREDAVHAAAEGALLPWGDESREHAVLMCRGSGAMPVAEELAAKLDLPCISTRADLKEFRQWEWDQTVPRDVTKLLNELAGRE